MRVKPGHGPTDTVAQVLGFHKVMAFVFVDHKLRFHAERFQRVDVGLDGQVSREDAMARVVPRQERHPHAFKCAHANEPTRLAERRVDADAFGGQQTR